MRAREIEKKRGIENVCEREGERKIEKERERGRRIEKEV